MQNAFFLQPEEYKRDINVIEHYVTQSAAYLNRITKQPLDKCAAFVRQTISPDGKRSLIDPQMKLLVRGDNGDRKKVLGTLTGYMNDVINNRELIAGTFTTYLHPEVKTSVITGFLDANIAGRAVAKHKMFDAIANKDEDLRSIYFNEQNGKKTANNSMSGAQAAKSTPLLNRTGHSTLTSTCRMTSGYGNANNEKFIAGNRHYWSYDTVINNIMSIVTNTDYVALETVMVKYGMKYPSPKEALECVTYSADFYWSANVNAKDTLLKVYRILAALSPLERAAFVYTGDLYQMAVHNPEIIRELLRRLSTRVDRKHNDHKAVLEKTHGDVKLFGCLLCAEFLRGTKLAEIKDKEEYNYYISTLENINETISDYFDFIRVFMVSNNVPASVSRFPDSIRRIVTASDTDSTIFTVEDWVKWYCGKITFTKEANAISDTIVFLAAQTITHVLAKMSANLGIVEDRIFQIAMKNEYKFDVFIPTLIGKHYYGVMSSQEGIIFDKLKKEIKGVHLKSSSAPKQITKQAEKMMLFICDEIIAGRKISIKKTLKEIGDTERDIQKSIAEGTSHYFRKAQIKTPSSYSKGADTSIYKQYALWNEIFGPKYGMVTEPPYTAVKVNVNLKTPSKTTDWLNEIQDVELANRVRQYMAKNDKRFLGGTIYIPEMITRSQGLPVEIIQAAGIRELIKDTTNVFYIILETLGVYMLNDKITRLVMDTH